MENQTLDPIWDDDDEPYDPNFDPCRWDDNRIEATKSLLFHEALAQGELR